MLSKKNRLPIQGLLNKKGTTYRKAFLSIKVFSSDLLISRFGFIISKKVAKSAVQRNKIRRMIFAAIKLVIDKWQKADYLVIVNSWQDLNQKQINDQFISYIFHSTAN